MTITFQPGAILLSCNRDQRLNTTPGKWNHCAIVFDAGHLIEAQRGTVENGKGRGVIVSAVGDYMSRDYSPVLMINPRQGQAGCRAAARAAGFVGLPYRTRIIQRGTMDCLDVCKFAWLPDDRRLAHVLLPDGLARQQGGRVFQPGVVIKQ